ncbi:MAG: UDP-N-acetylmuramate dehydrogenase [Patescibacteria group bacterium]|nr:UDP-N-acetylmuramate dehydrogenase [Patescibacteria group bacterium]
MEIKTEVLLGDMTSFKIGGKASYFALVKTIDDIKEAILFAKNKKIPWFVIGGGTNILINDNGYKGLVIKNDIKGVDGLKIGAGENWDEFVGQCVEDELYGVENLSGIPGTIGASPVQNIGAYGVEVKDVIESVDVLNTECLTFETLSNKDCCFKYRDSIFKKPEGKKYIITYVTFKLKKKGELNIEYKDLRNYFFEKNVAPTLEKVRKAVLEIRGKKFPDLSKYGTAGSFFKNPIINKLQYEKLLEKYPLLPNYYVDENNVKIPLAWVLDNICNLKGVRKGDIGTYEKQPLVLVNWGHATAKEVKEYAEKIANCVKEKIGIDIELEVQFLD